MYNKIKIGEKEIGFAAYAGCDIFYRQIFHEDPTALQYAPDFDEPKMIGFIQRMGFVMAMLAEKPLAEMRKLNEDAFVEWMCGFDRADYMAALPDIRATYEGQMLTTSDAKKNNDQPSEG